MRSGTVIDEQGKLNTFAVEPRMYAVEPQAGSTEHAEKLNGRLAMIGFVSLMLLEVVTGHSLIGLLTSL